MVLTFIVFMCIFAAIGLWSAVRSTGSTKDYLLASRQIPAWLAGLSAVATNNSGYMFIGMIGYTYTQGLSSLWMMMGWLVGDYAASRLLYERVCITTGKYRALSFSGLVSRWHGGAEYRWVRIISGVLTVVFLVAYAAAQLKAGSKALHVLLGWDYAAGAILGAVIVLAYCAAGGLRASIWTDAAQSIVMIGAMGLLCVLAVLRAGGFDAFVEALEVVSPHYLDLFPYGMELGPVTGPLLFVAGWLFAGFGVAGQPHVLVRFMAITDSRAIRRARMYYYSWFAGFYTLTIGAGLATRLFVDAGGGLDMELALPLMARELLPAAGLGVVLAGMFAATMSTADSQILSCTASITQDLLPKYGQSLWFNKGVTALLAFAALGIALSNNQSVFSLVLMAWAALASAFIPLLLVQAYGGKPSQPLAIAMMLGGLFTCIGWKAAGLGTYLYEIAPGMMAGFSIYCISQLIIGRCRYVRWLGD